MVVILIMNKYTITLQLEQIMSRVFVRNNTRVYRSMDFIINSNLGCFFKQGRK